MKKYCVDETDYENENKDKNTSNESPKKTRKKVKTEHEDSSVKIIPAPQPQTSMSYIQENIPYATAYNDTNRQLDEAIMQLNVIGGELMNDLQGVRASKTLRNKYNIITEMTETTTSIIGAKITAIKEKNKTINDINHLELARMKEMKSTMNADDDNTRIANMYDAFINTPIGVGPINLGPSMQDMMLPQSSALNRISLGGDQIAWEQSLNPAENRMVLEAKGLIDTVVMYDNATGNRWFEVIDKQTGQPVPNVEKPGNEYIYDLDINVRGGFAKDSNRNTTYPLVVLNGGDNISEY